MDLLGEGAFDAVVLAASEWQQAPGELPTVVVMRGEDDPIGYRRNGKNKNTVRFSPDGDPMANGALAITVITFDAHAKQILDADIVLNGEHGFDFFEHDARDQGMSTYDLQNVLTHEFGHLLGLGEELGDNDATMYAFSQPGEIGKRDLELIDQESIAELYAEPLDPELAGGCGGAAIAGYEGADWMWAAFGMVGLGLMMRRRALRGTVLTSGALAALLTYAGAWSASGVDGEVLSLQGGAVPMRVTAAESSWEGDLIVTRLSLRSEQSGRELSVRALGGQVGDLVQVVGHALPPTVGDSLHVKLSSGLNGEAIWVAPMIPRTH